MGMNGEQKVGQEYRRDVARAVFEDAGLTTADVTRSDAERLRDMIGDRLKAAGTSITVDENVTGEIRGKKGKLKISCSSNHFSGREAVVFYGDGFVGIAGWADAGNLEPIAEAFEAWSTDVALRYEAEKYVLLTSLDEEGLMARVSDPDAVLAVSFARPKPGSTTERVIFQRSTFVNDVEGAAKDMFDRMRATGLPGVLDAAELRAHRETPLAFCERLTEEIHDDLPDLDDEDARDDDFDNHPLSPLREAMVDNCPEFSGEEPSP